VNVADLHARAFVVLVVRGCTHNWEIETKNMLERQRDQMQVNENTRVFARILFMAVMLAFCYNK
jgi:hypothetical protein